ncbi:hypothetical protein GGD55_006158 [Rhizobium giardinii]|jgi:hypothetical protein|uniref:Uncharacterized protein n=1 Tax=Rhizobium giardinii TaxID=56731 RepID=A0A7W8UHM5_9HYPH|nr:hypothetical protein [Rhizobium giardinii]
MHELPVSKTVTDTASAVHYDVVTKLLSPMGQR